VCFDYLKIIGGHARHPHVALLWCILEVERETFVSWIGLVQKWVTATDARALVVVGKTNDAILLFENIIVSSNLLDLTEREVIGNEIANSEYISRDVALDTSSSYLRSRL